MRRAVWIVIAVSMIGSWAWAQDAKNAAERFVKQRMNNDGVADLNTSGLADKDKKIGHEFLEDLITNTHPPEAVAAHGVWIKNATIDGVLNINNVKIAFPLGFTNCTFTDGIDLEYDQLEHNFLFTKNTVGTQPAKGEKPTGANAAFMGIKVQGVTELDDTKFYSDVDFTYAEFGSEFDARRVEFASDADFDTARSRAPMFFENSRFANGLDLEDADLFSLFVKWDAPKDGGTAEPMTPMVLNLNQAHIAHGLGIENVSLANLQAGWLDVSEQTDFLNVIPVGSVDLKRSHFQDLSIKGFQPWLDKGSSSDFHLEGISFDAVEVLGEKEPSAMRLLELIDASKSYSPQPYLELEKFLRSHGNPAEADTTYIHMRRKERDKMSWLKYPFDLMLDGLVGYGKAPWQSAFPALLLVIIGAILFPRSAMVPAEKESNDPWYNRVWYSLDLLSPIDLGVSKKWRPRDPTAEELDKDPKGLKCHLLRNYAQVHRVAGWILIPLIAAAITGIIK